jgi:hypothetical protein
MLPPLDALSVAAAVVEFVHFGLDIISAARGICNSAETAQNATLGITVAAFDDLSKAIAESSTDNLKTQYPNLVHLVTESQSLSCELSALLRKITAKDLDSAWQRSVAVIKAKLREGKIDGLAARLDECRKQIGLELQWLTR